jgi:hypothetical protein
LIRASVQDDFNGWTLGVLDVGIAEPQVFELPDVATRRVINLQRVPI